MVLLIMPRGVNFCLVLKKNKKMWYNCSLAQVIALEDIFHNFTKRIGCGMIGNENYLYQRSNETASIGHHTASSKTYTTK